MFMIKASNYKYANHCIQYIIGGRTVIVALDIGDTLQLFWDHGDGDVGHITFCVSLSTMDY